MSRRYGIRDARPILGDLIRDAQLGADIIITRNNKDVVRLTLIQEVQMPTITVEHIRELWDAEFEAPGDARGSAALALINGKLQVVPPSTTDSHQGHILLTNTELHEHFDGEWGDDGDVIAASLAADLTAELNN